MITDDRDSSYCFAFFRSLLAARPAQTASCSLEPSQEIPQLLATVPEFNFTGDMQGCENGLKQPGNIQWLAGWVGVSPFPSFDQEKVGEKANILALDFNQNGNFGHK